MTATIRTALSILTVSLLAVACDDPTPSDGATASASTGSTTDDPAGTSTTGDETPTTGEPTTDDTTSDTSTTSDASTTSGSSSTTDDPTGVPAFPDCASEPHPFLVASIPQGEYPYQSLAIRGDRLLAPGVLGIDLIDIADPQHPSVLLDDAGVSGAQFVTVHDDRIYVGGHNKGIAEVTVSDDAIVPLGHSFSPVTYRFAVGGTVAYALDNNLAQEVDVTIVDLAALAQDPAPEPMFDAIDGPAGGVLIADDHLYVAGTSLRVFSLADPLAPVLVGSLPVDGSRMLRHADHLYLAPLFGGDHLQIVDITDPSLPVDAGTVEFEGFTPTFLGLAGDREQGTVYVLDLEIPTEPALVGIVEPARELSALAVEGQYLYLSLADRLEIYGLCIE